MITSLWKQLQQIVWIEKEKKNSTAKDAVDLNSPSDKINWKDINDSMLRINLNGFFLKLTN